MTSAEVTVGAVLAAILGITVLYAQPPSSVDGKSPVTTSSSFHLWRSEGEADGTISVRDGSGVVLGRYVLRDDGVFESPEQAAGGPLHVSLTRDYYLGDPGFDLGAWTGYYRGGRNGDALQAGLRVSPARFLYGTLAPDLIVSADVIGAGVTVFPPTQLVGSHWRHLGIGAWYVAPFDGGAPGWAVGASFSIR